MAGQKWRTEGKLQSERQDPREQSQPPPRSSADSCVTQVGRAVQWEGLPSLRCCRSRSKAEGSRVASEEGRLRAGGVGRGAGHCLSSEHPS